MGVSSETEAFVAEMLRTRDESHGFEHAVAVRDLSLEVWRLGLEASDAAFVGARDGAEHPERIVETAAMLHDVLDHKYVDAAEARRLGEQIDAFLRGLFGADPAEGAGAVRAIVAAVSYSKENKALEAGQPAPWRALGEHVQTLRHVVSDADKMEALGEIGLDRCFQYSRERRPDASDEAILIDVVQHCQEKLLRLLPDFIRTEPGRRLARPRHDFIQRWYERHAHLLAT